MAFLMFMHCFTLIEFLHLYMFIHLETILKNQIASAEISSNLRMLAATENLESL